MEDMIGFPGRARPCRDFRWGGGCTRSDCSLIRGGEKPSLLTIIRVLEEAQETLDVCSPTTTCEELSTHARGVTVRAITNDCKKHASTPQAQSFLDALFTARGVSPQIQSFIDAGILLRDAPINLAAALSGSTKR
ncbi:Mitochondrial cardiolipin hydrolase [Globisporangium polare]